jgi:PAS domain S-box-containing protein
MSAGRQPRPHLVNRAVLELGESLLAEHDLPSLLRLATDVVLDIIQTDLAAAGRQSSALMRRLVDSPDALSVEAMRTGTAVVVRDLAHDRRFATDTPSTTGGGQAGSRIMLSGITMPINLSPAPFGVLTGRSWKSRSFTAAQILVVEDTAALLGRTLDRRANELKLRESEERFRQLADRSPDALFRTRLHPEPRLEYISSSVEAISGYTADELVNGDRSTAWNVIHPEDREKARAFLSEPDNLPYPLVLRWIHKSGSVVWTEQHVTPVLDAEGQWVAYQGVIRDVTDRTLVEQRHQAQAEVTQLILEGRTASEVLEAAAGHLSQLSGANYALLALPARGRPAWEVRIIDGEPESKPREITLPEDDALIRRVVAGNATVAIANLSTALPADHEFRRLGWLGSALLEPIRGSHGLLGVLGIANVAEGRRFSDIGSRAVGDFARQVALAIEYELARDDRQRLAVLDDRGRISRELHDGVIQSLFGAGMMLESISETTGVSPQARDGIARVAQMIDNTMVDIRSYIFDLSPSALTDRSLEEGLRLLAEDFEKASSIHCSIEVDPQAVIGLDEAAPQIIQISREALSNVARHSHASECDLRLYRENADVLLEIRDNGRGFQPSNVKAGSGLKNIRGRAAQIGAFVEFVSRPQASPSPTGGAHGGGSTVRIHIPLASLTK